MHRLQAEDTVEVKAAGRWVGAFAELAHTVFVPTDPQLRIVHWPASAEALTGWRAERAVGFGLGTVLSLARATLVDLRSAIDAGIDLNDVLLPARRQGGSRCQLRAGARIVRDEGGATIGVAWSLRLEIPPGTTVPPADSSVLDLALARWTRAFDRLPFPVALVDTVGSVRLANTQASHLLGVEVGRPCCSTLCGAAGPQCRNSRALRSLTPAHWEFETQGKRLDMSALPIAIHGEAPDFVLCFGTPSEPHLSAELRKFFRAVDENLVGVVITDASARVEYANQRASEILGCSPLELVSRDVREFYSPPPYGNSAAHIPLEQGSLEVQVQRGDGDLRPVRAAISDIPDEDGQIANWVILLDDISERRALEARERDLREQVARSARLAAVGEIATMIAHEINQPLSNIANFGRGLLHRLARGKVDESALTDTLEEIVRQIERADTVVRNVRRLARSPAAKTTSADANALINANLPTFHLLARSAGVRIDTDLAGTLPAVPADASQIEQVLINLVKNAVEVCESLPAETRRVTVRTRLAAGGVAIEVADPAPMLSPESLKRIGEPFYTTKPDGLGLGLSISRTLLENHGSRLSVRPQPEGGKAFHFELAAVHEPD